ncbi:hypothetical protein JCM19992_30760 [Thermostilla marina]
MRKFLLTGAFFGACCAAVLTLGPTSASRAAAQADEPTVYAVWEENGEYRWEPIYPSSAESADKTNEQETSTESTDGYDEAGSDLGYDPYEYDPYLYESYEDEGWYADDFVDAMSDEAGTFQSTLESYSEYYDEFGQPYEDYWYRNYTGITGDVPSADFFVVDDEASQQDESVDAGDDGWYAAGYEDGVGDEYDVDDAYESYDEYYDEYETEMEGSYDGYDEADEYYRYDEGYGYDAYYSGVYDESMDDYEYGEYPYDAGSDDLGDAADDTSWWTGDDDSGDTIEAPADNEDDAESDDDSWDYPYYYGCRWDDSEPEPGSEEAAHEGVDVDYGMQRADELTSAEVQPQVGGDFTDGDSEWYYEESWYYDDSQDEEAVESDDEEYGFEDAYGESYTYEYEAYEPAAEETDAAETYSDYWYDEYEYYDETDDVYDAEVEQAEPSSFTRMRSFPADPDVSPMGNERDYEAEVAAEWMASEYAASEPADWQDWEYVYEETSVDDDTSWRVFDTPLEGEPGEPTATYAIDEMDDIAGECFRQDEAVDTFDVYDEYEEYEYADPYDYYGDDYEDGYLGDEGAAVEYDDPWETASETEATSFDEASSNLLAAWAPGQLLTPEDQDFLGVLESLAEESSGVRRAEFSRYLDQVGLDALDLAARFEEQTGIDTLGLADDIPGVAAFLGVVRLIEMGDIDIDEAVTLLRQNLSHMPLEWIEGATSTAADHYPSDIPRERPGRLMPTLGNMLFQAGVSLAVTMQAGFRQTGEHFTGTLERMTAKLRAAADMHTFMR